MAIAGPTDSLGNAQTARLHELRARLLHLHKALLAMEQRDFEKMFGRVSTGELLQLTINHAQFGWLRMISALVVKIDEILHGEEPATTGDFEAVVSQARSLLAASSNEQFKTKYQAALQREPSVVMAHSVVMQLLRQED